MINNYNLFKIYIKKIFRYGGQKRNNNIDGIINRLLEYIEIGLEIIKDINLNRRDIRLLK